MNKYLKLAVAIGISLAGLYFAFRGVEFEELLGAITRVNGFYIFASIFLMVFSVVLRALRWRLILGPLQNISFHPLFGATMIGYFGNSVLPFRLGELLRAYSLSRTKPISASEAFGTIVLERVLDMIGVLVVMVFFFVLYPFPPWLKLSGLVAGFGTGILILVLIGLALAQSEIKNKIFSWKIFQNPIGQKFRKVIENLVTGLVAIKSTKHLFAIIFYTIVMWVVYYACTYLVVLSINVPVDWIAVGVTLVATTLAITIPAAPGYIGTYHATAVLVMVELFGVQLADAQAFAVLVHAIGFVPFAIIGFGYFLTSSVKLKDVRKNEF